MQGVARPGMCGVPDLGMSVPGHISQQDLHTSIAIIMDPRISDKGKIIFSLYVAEFL